MATARAAVARGHRVRLITRSGRPAPAGAESVRGDAVDPDTLAGPCAGAAAIHHCAGAPYGRWPALLPAMMAGLIAAAGRAGARLIYGDNLYMYGAVDRPMTEDLPDRPVGPKGHTRATVAGMLLAADRGGQVRAAIGRAPDFFGPGVEVAALGAAAFRAAAAGRAVPVLGDPDMPHSWCFIEDFGAALVTLAERDAALGQVWHVPCAPPASTRDLVALIGEAAGTRPKLRVAGRRLVTLLGLFNATMRELKEVLYQFERPFVVDCSKFERAFATGPTPLRDAVGRTVQALGRPDT